MASLVPPNYVCPRAHDVVLYLDSFFICWLVLEPSRQVEFVPLSNFSDFCCSLILFFAKKKKASREFCVLSLGVSGVTLHEMKDGSF